MGAGRPRPDTWCCCCNTCCCNTCCGPDGPAGLDVLRGREDKGGTAFEGGRDGRQCHWEQRERAKRAKRAPAFSLRRCCAHVPAAARLISLVGPLLSPAKRPAAGGGGRAVASHRPEHHLVPATPRNTLSFKKKTRVAKVERVALGNLAGGRVQEGPAGWGVPEPELPRSGGVIRVIAIGGSL